jgi:hypothetical protein
MIPSGEKLSVPGLPATLPAARLAAIQLGRCEEKGQFRMAASSAFHLIGLRLYGVRVGFNFFHSELSSTR